MNLAPQATAAAEALAALEVIGHPACLIGGLALQRWGEPRMTQDADLTVLAPLGTEASIVDALLDRFRARTADARRHALEYRVLLLHASNGVSLDISLAALPFEEEVFRRASRWRQIGETWLTTCSAEDLVIYKLVAARPQDLVDIQGIVERQRGLDVERIRYWGSQFAEAKADPDLLLPFERALTKGRRPL
jgi:hypothetical protein